MTEHAVVIAGGGPTGLMLAGELALAGIDVVIVERRVSQDLDGSRSGGLHSRTIEVLDQRGIAERFLSAGQVMQVQGFAGIPLDISDFPTRHNYGLALWQSHFERILAGWVDELGVPILRGCEVVGFAQDDTGVDVELSGDMSLRAEYLVGCDGGRSLTRKAAGIDFTGLDPSTSWMIAEVQMDEEPQFGFRRDSAGQHALGRRAAAEPIRVVLTERHLEHIGDPSMSDLREALVAVYGTDYGLRSANWISRFTDMTRQAASYRHGRVVLAGDAAHVHPPQGGQGLNTGVQDAVNLGWKLAQVVNKTSPDSLLDTYHAERHPVGARVLHNTMAQVALGSPDDRHQALRDTMTELLSMDEPRRRIAAMLSGLDIHYDLGEGHPLLGRRMPDLDVHTADGPTRVFTLLHDARPVLLNLGEPGGLDMSPWANRVRRVDAKHDGVWELPVLGEIAAPPAVLIRPDGHVAWAGDLTDPELPQALATWFGAATPAHQNRTSERHRAHHLSAVGGQGVGDVSGFQSRGQFASSTGTAPIAVSPGDHPRHRLSRSGNRRRNHTIHIAAVVPIRHDRPGRAYYRRKLAEGRSNREAWRGFKRRISGAIWRQLQLDQQPDQHQDQSWPRWPSRRGALLVVSITRHAPTQRQADDLTTGHGLASTAGLGVWPL